jgi:hypothetical protein
VRKVRITVAAKITQETIGLNYTLLSGICICRNRKKTKVLGEAKEKRPNIYPAVLAR